MLSALPLFMVDYPQKGFLRFGNK